MATTIQCRDASCLCVEDVYEMAASIGKDFECLINGEDDQTCVGELMQKVIRALEYLEQLVDNSDKKSTDEIGLTASNGMQQAEAEILLQQKEAESDEQNRQREIFQQMQDYISELEAECIRLRREVQNRELISSAASVVFAACDHEKQLDALHRDTLNYQACIQSLHLEIGQKNMECEAMQQQLERLLKLNQDYLQNIASSGDGSEKLQQHVTELQTLLEQTELQLADSGHHCRRYVDADAGTFMPVSGDTLAPVSSIDGSAKPASVHVTCSSAKPVCADAAPNTHVTVDAASSAPKLVNVNVCMGTVEPVTTDMSTNTASAVDVNTLGTPVNWNARVTTSMPCSTLVTDETLCEQRQQIFFDPKDPDRPRYSLAELQQVIFKRNELQARLDEVEDELQYYKNNARLDNKNSAARKSASKTTARKSSNIEKVFAFLKPAPNKNETSVKKVYD